MCKQYRYYSGDCIGKCVISNIDCMYLYSCDWYERRKKWVGQQ